MSECNNLNDKFKIFYSALNVQHRTKGKNKRKACTKYVSQISVLFFISLDPYRMQQQVGFYRNIYAPFLFFKFFSFFYVRRGDFGIFWGEKLYLRLLCMSGRNYKRERNEKFEDSICRDYKLKLIK